MLIIERITDEDGTKSIVLECQDQDDLWHLYNIVRVGDCVTAVTDRRIKGKYGDHPWCRSFLYREVLELKIRVISVYFDPLYSGLHVSGQVQIEIPKVPLGVHHTLDIRPHTRFAVSKKNWDSIDIQRLEQSVGIYHENIMGAVVLQEGLAQICVITEHLTIVKAKIQMQVSRKRAGFAVNHEKSLQRFLETVAQTFLRHIDIDEMKAVILAGRGFLHETFKKTLFNVADKMNTPFKLTQKKKFFSVSISSGFMHSFKEILADPATAPLLADTKAQEDMNAYNTFMDLFRNDASRAFYGYKHVVMANEENAIDTLMVSDTLFRSKNVEKRKKYIELVESVQEKGGKVLIFSSLHVSGELLNQITGVAAILRYPLPELEDEDMDDETEDTDDEEVEDEEDNPVIKVPEYVVKEFPSNDIDVTAS